MNKEVRKVNALTLNERLAMEKQARETVVVKSTKKQENKTSFKTVLKNITGMVVVAVLLSSMFIYGLDHSPLTKKVKAATTTTTTVQGGTK